MSQASVTFLLRCIHYNGQNVKMHNFLERPVLTDSYNFFHAHTNVALRHTIRECLHYLFNISLDLHCLYTLSLTCCLSSLCHLNDFRFVSSNNLFFIDFSSFSKLPILSYSMQKKSICTVNNHSDVQQSIHSVFYPV